MNKNGFTLIEVILILAILGLVLFPILLMFGTGLRVSTQVESTATAIHLGCGEMESIKNLSFSDIINQSRGQIEPGFEREIAISQLHTNLKQVEVIVYFSQNGEELTLTLQTLIANCY